MTDLRNLWIVFGFFGPVKPYCLTDVKAAVNSIRLHVGDDQ
jgi:hypothetical protein